MKNVYINIEDNPGFLNSFLDYTATILNKSQNTVKEYNYDLNTFLKYILYHFKMTNEKDLKQISIRNMSLETVSKITAFYDCDECILCPVRGRKPHLREIRRIVKSNASYAP